MSETIYATGSIGDITLFGGSIGEYDTCTITAENGRIGDITVKAARYKVPSDLVPGGWETRYSYAGIGDVEVKAGNRIGDITVLGGDCGGVFRAGNGIGNVTVRGIIDSQSLSLVGGGFTSSLEARRIGDVRVEGSVPEAAIQADKSLGDVTVEAQTVRVRLKMNIGDYSESFAGRFAMTPDPMQLHIFLGDSQWDGWNHMGAIRLLGVDMTLEGDLFDLRREPRVISRAIENAWVDSEDEGLLEYWGELGGLDQLTNNLSLLTNQQPSSIPPGGDDSSGYSVTFEGFTEGDSQMNGNVGSSDLGILPGNGGNSSTAWEQGDFTGD